MSVENLSVKSRLKEYKILRNENVRVLYDRETLYINVIPDAMADRLEMILANLDHIPDSSPLWGKFTDLIKQMESFNIELPTNITGLEHKFAENEKEKKLFSELKPTRYLPKLAINIANACNLACSYCYANEGLYGTPKQKLMTQEDIEATIRRFADNFDYIRQIQFMGGEPSMNPEAIEKTARLFEELVDAGKLRAVAKLGMVTNGVKFSPKFLDICRKYDVGLTISIDGPKEIHDHIRVRSNGSGSYDAIRKNITIAKDNGLRISFEPTFSRRHLECGMSVKDLCQWFFDEFNHRVLHAPPMSENKYSKGGLGLSPQEKMQQYCEVTEWGLKNLLRGQFLMHGFTERTWNTLRTRSKNENLCPAGTSQLAVSFKGDVSPCWMFTDEEPFYMGNVKKDDFLGANALALTEVLHETDLKNHSECKKCWIQPICFGCRGADYMSSQKIDAKTTDCDYMRAMMETFILTGSEVFVELAKRKKNNETIPIFGSAVS